MPNAKKQIILNEILFWKQNKMLPEQYCDFLITLYSEGNEIEFKAEVSHKKAIKARENRQRNLLSMMAILIAITLIVLLFMVTKMTWLVITIAGVVAILLIISAFKFAKKNNMITPILHIAAALLLLGLSVKISINYFGGNDIVLFTLLLLNCLVWMVTGLKFKIMYYTLAGLFGMIVMISYKMFFL